MCISIINIDLLKSMYNLIRKTLAKGQDMIFPLDVSLYSLIPFPGNLFFKTLLCHKKQFNYTIVMFLITH